MEYEAFKQELHMDGITDGDLWMAGVGYLVTGNSVWDLLSMVFHPDGEARWSLLTWEDFYNEWIWCDGYESWQDGPAEMIKYYIEAAKSVKEAAGRLIAG